MAPLQGIRIIELARVLAGPWCGMTLADLGADVIKLEPLTGDDTRGLGPPFRDGLSAYFACLNRNKRSLAIDLVSPDGRRIVEKLVRSADVVIQNYRTGTDAALGVDYATLSALNPRLVYCSISGYGRTGPGKNRSGYDFVVQAEAGLMSINGPIEGEPAKVGVAVVDVTTAQNAAIAILAALRARDRSGRGQHLDIALFDTQLQWLANIASSVLFTGEDAKRWGNAHPSIVPYQAFRASDDYFVVAVASEKLWRTFCEAIAHPEWVNDPRFACNADRVSHREALIAGLKKVFATRTAADWIEHLNTAGVPCGPINTVKQALEHPVAVAHEMVREIGGIPQVGSPLCFSDTPVEYRLPPPCLGEHTDEILRELGEDPTELRARRAVV